MALKNHNVYVIGHKSPDTDSICSAIAYANLKNEKEKSDKYIAMRAGNINDETAYVLDRFHISAPVFVSDISNKVSDIEISEIPGVERTISLKEAWELMRRLGTPTLPITRHGRLEGVITMEDIARSYMDTANNGMISTAHTKFRKIEETIDGKIVAGNPEAYYTEGKVLIAAADADYMASHIEEHDMVILGNREELQQRAIECKAGCLVVCTVPDISEETKKLAEKYNCTVICANRDTYTIARLVGQSMPISYFMTREHLSTFRQDELTDTIKDVMAKKRFKNFPVLDKKGHYVGMISRRSLINEDKRKIILVDHNEKGQAVDGLEFAEILEIIDHHKIGAVETLSPIYFRNQPLGCTATIIARMYGEEGVKIVPQIAGLLLSAIVSDTLMFRSPTCTPYDIEMAECMAQVADVRISELATSMFTAGSNFENKSIEEIFFQDFKKFTTSDYSYGVGQANVLTEEDGNALKQRIIDYLKKGFNNPGFHMTFFMLTNILEESTELIFIGDKAREIVFEAFEKEPEENSIILEHVVSRKKQLLPALMNAMQN